MGSFKFAPLVAGDELTPVTGGPPRVPWKATLSPVGPGPPLVTMKYRTLVPFLRPTKFGGFAGWAGLVRNLAEVLSRVPATVYEYIAPTLEKMSSGLAPVALFASVTMRKSSAAMVIP